MSILRSSAFMILFCVLFPLPSNTADAGEARYRIVFRDGRSVLTEDAYEQGDMVYYQRYGVYIGVERSSVRAIEDIGSAVSREKGAGQGQFVRKTVDLQDRIDAARAPVAFIATLPCQWSTSRRRCRRSPRSPER